MKEELGQVEPLTCSKRKEQMRIISLQVNVNRGSSVAESGSTVPLFENYHNRPNPVVMAVLVA